MLAEQRSDPVQRADDAAFDLVGDVVVVAGKGHETTQTIGATITPFDDRLVARADELDAWLGEAFARPVVQLARPSDPRVWIAVYFDDPNGHVMEIITHPYGDRHAALLLDDRFVQK